MPRFRPFRALRYAVDDLATVTAPPYDVLSEAEVRALAASSEHNVVHVDVPLDGADRYRRAAARLQAWRDGGVLVQDAEPSFTLYRLRFTDATGAERDLVGVLGGLEVVDEGAGGVLPHERTTPKASTDRLDLTRATRANLSPVWGLSLAPGLTALLRAPGEVLGSVVDGGVEHVVERVTDPERVAAIAAAVGADDVLIADGHHRYAISRTYRDEVRAATGGDAGAAEETLAFVGELVPEQLSVAAIHRLYSGVDAPTLRAALARRFELTPADRPGAGTLAAMAEEGFLTLVEPDATWRLTARPGAFDGVRALDGGWLETALADQPVAVTYQHGLDAAVAAVTSGRAAAAVLIRPVSVAEIERTAREGLLMPPKSTFFTPKLKTGFVVRPLAD
ncbi:DUF1015 family protein [Friedmanniella luteola]|uniref:DUF1015 family protein n=1 Tax=Friedmanniella luteola TaxID=546871 RepID=UPI000B821857|nr:DUF1015 domain-containing protein [Friedmanniella luteola]